MSVTTALAGSAQECSTQWRCLRDLLHYISFQVQLVATAHNTVQRCNAEGVVFYELRNALCIINPVSASCFCACKLPMSGSKQAVPLHTFSGAPVSRLK
jgi:hypothetical protein